MTENIDEICAKIKKEADAEVAFILNKARKEEEKILAEARADADQRKNDLIFNLEQELGKIRDRIFSTLNLEKKKIILEEKNRLVEEVFALVRQKAVSFRKEKGYADFLRQAIAEGIKVIGTEKAVVLFSALDEKLVNEQVKGKLAYTFKKEEFTDIGVIVQSADGRLVYNNRFEARFKRAYDELYMRLLREAF
jgi:vacuolar-type H+-ATPase subunit E/Vma4